MATAPPHSYPRSQVHQKKKKISFSIAPPERSEWTVWVTCSSLNLTLQPGGCILWVPCLPRDGEDEVGVCGRVSPTRTLWNGLLTRKKGVKKGF